MIFRFFLKKFKVDQGLEDIWDLKNNKFRYYPFSCFSHGGNADTPSPLEEGWDKGRKLLMNRLVPIS